MRVYSLLFAANGLFYNIVIFYVMIIVYNVDNKPYYQRYYSCEQYNLYEHTI